MDLKNFQGNVKKSAIVFSNDPRNPRITLVMQGEVKPLVQLRPVNAVSFRGMADRLNDQVIDITSTSTSFRINRVESNLGENIGYQLETVEDGRHYRLKVSNRLEEGTYQGAIRCYTDNPKKPEIVIRVSGAIEGEISVKPRTLIVGKLDARQEMHLGKVLVTSNSEKSFNITKLSYNERLIRVTQHPLPEGTGFALEIAPNLENIPQGRERHQTLLVIETDAKPDQKYEVHIHLVHL